jgi:hypothetical protein
VTVDAEHTDGQYELFEVDAARGPTPLHRTGWGKAYYVLNGRMIVHVEDVPRGRPIEEVTQQIQEVLARHDVTLAGFETAGLEPVW